MGGVHTCREARERKRNMGFFLLTTIGDGETVRHFQIVNVRRQSEFRSAKLNHPYPKRAVLLVRAPWKESPWNRNIKKKYQLHLPKKKIKTFSNQSLHLSLESILY